jgi:hypothetical protein
VKQAFTALFMFAFVPHDWWSMHRDVPVFGFLFTLLLLVLPCLRATRRIWLLVAWAELAILIWFCVHHEDRYLQTIMPWLAAVTGAIIVLIWRSQRLASRAMLSTLIAAQLVWGADVYFYPTHSILGAAPIKATVDLLGQGFLGNYAQRLEVAGHLEQQQIGSALHGHAVLLVHESREHLGYGRKTITDFYADQYGIDYLTLATPQRVDARLRELGVTHLVWQDQSSVAYAPLGGDLVFFEFAYRHARSRHSVGSRIWAKMPKRAPMPMPAPMPAQEQAQEPARVAILGCGEEYATGVYLLPDLAVPRFGPASRSYPPPRGPLPSGSRLRHEVDAIVLDRSCHESLPPRLSGPFEKVANRPLRDREFYELWIRKRPR